MSQSVQINCGARLSIEQVEALQQQMEQAVRDGADIELQGGEIQYCDTAGLQLMLALFKAASRTSQSVSWQSASEVLKETSGWLGLGDALALSGH